jgi:WD40 repeat protein
MLTLYDLEKRCTVWQQQEMLGREEWKHVGQACFTADGKWIATKGQHVRLWDATTGKELWKTNVQRPEPLGFLDGGKTLVLHGWENNSISLVDRATGKQCRSFPMTKRAETRDSEYVLSPDGSAVLCGSYGPLVRVWDMATGKERPALEGHKTWTRYFAFTPDCKTIVTGGNDPFALVRDWPSGKVVRTIELGRPYIARMAISRDGRRLEVQFWGEQELQLYDLKTGKLLPPPGDGHRGDVIGAAVAPDGRLLSFGRDATIRTWEIQTGRIVGRMPVEQDLNGGGFAVSGDGRLLATTNRGLDAVLVYDRATGKQLHKLPAAERIFGKQLVFSSDGRWLARTQRLGGDIQVWDVSTGRTVLQCKHEVEYGIACAFSPDGRQFAASDHGRVRFWDLRTWREQPEWMVSAPLGLAYSPDGRTLAAASVEGIRLFELATHRERAHIQAAGYPEGVLRFSSTGRWLAWTTNSVAQRIHEKKLWPPTGGEGIFVWDIHRGEMLSSFTGHEGDITGLDFGVDDRALVSSSQDSTLLVWDIAGKIAKQPPRKAGDVERAWRDLLGDDAKAAYEAIRVLSASPDAAIKLLARNLKPAPIDKKGIDAWLRDLDSDDFAARERATRELERLGEQAVPALERFLAGKPSLEARRRVELLLEKSHGPTPEHLRQIRALEALERIGDDDARRLLEALAKGTADTWLTRDAKASLERIRR